MMDTLTPTEAMHHGEFLAWESAVASSWERVGRKAGYSAREWAAGNPFPALALRAVVIAMEQGA